MNVREGISGPTFGGTDSCERGRTIWEIAKDYNTQSLRLNKGVYTRTRKCPSKHYEPVALI